MAVTVAKGCEVAAILLAVVPLFVLTLAHFLVPGGRMTRWRIIGFVIGFFAIQLCRLINIDLYVFRFISFNTPFDHRCSLSNQRSCLIGFNRTIAAQIAEHR